MSKSNEIKYDYWIWLRGLIGANDPESTRSSYFTLLWKLHATEFYWTVERDANRASDGKDLREAFEDATGKDKSEIDIPCTLLEMMIALARRYDGEVGDINSSNVPDIFWGMVDHLGLSGMDDEHYDPEKVDDILTRFLDRSYEKDGFGGLFPLVNPREDQRKVEIWYQMQAYLIENAPNFV